MGVCIGQSRSKRLITSKRGRDGVRLCNGDGSESKCVVGQ